MSIDVRSELVAMLNRQGLLGGDLLVALSGGLDSVCLLRLLVSVRDQHGGRVEVAHVDHALRAESADEAGFCRSLAKELACPFHLRRLGPGVWRGGEGRQAAARRARREFFEEVSARRGLVAVALGHHADDQVETVLYRLVRGAGPRGIGGMEEFAPPYVRPLLGMSRVRLQALVAERGWEYREDSSNQSNDYARNRLRNQVVPLLTEIHPGATAGVLRFANLAAEDDRVMSRLAREAVMEFTVIEPEGVHLSVAQLATLEAPLRRRVYLALWSGFGWPMDRLHNRHLEAVDALLQPGRAHRFAPVPGPGRFVVSYDKLWLLSPRPHLPEAPLDALLSAPGCDAVATSEGMLRWERALPPGQEGLGVPACRQQGVRVRGRRPGDRLERPGKAPRKLKDLLIASRVPIWRRAGVLVASAGDGVFGALGRGFVGGGWGAAGGWLWLEALPGGEWGIR